MPDIQNKAQYQEYVKTVSDFAARENIGFLSTGDGEDSEPWFSWLPCEMCGCNLGGNREHLHAREKATGKRMEYTICVDCVYFVNYGRLDDQTMLRVGD